MKMKNRFGLIIIVLLFVVKAGCQELNCNVSVNTNTQQGTNKQVYTTMETSIREFMNNTVWTNHVYENAERIECNLMITIMSEPSGNDYKAKISIQSRRPIYGSSYNSVLFNYIDDDVLITYAEFDPIDYSDNTFISNLSSLLSYYAYLIIGLDYDSFSPEGGTPYFQKAEKIVDLAQSTSYTGWKAGDSRERKNRYWIINNLLDSKYKKVRDFNYQYHRQGLDLMEKSIETGRAGVMESVELLQEFYKDKPDPFMSFMQILIDSKSEELVDIFSQAPDPEKQKILTIMGEIDPGGANKYSQLRK